MSLNPKKFACGGLNPRDFPCIRSLNLKNFRACGGLEPTEFALYKVTKPQKNPTHSELNIMESPLYKVIRFSMARRRRDFFGGCGPYKWEMHWICPAAGAIFFCFINLNRRHFPPKIVDTCLQYFLLTEPVLQIFECLRFFYHRFSQSTKL